MAFPEKRGLRALWPSVAAFAVALFAVLPIARAAGATFSLSAQTGSYNVGDTIPITVYLNADQPINAVSGIISFPPDKLAVISVSQTGSIINLWVQNPTYSNVAGTINFQGVILNPGYAGSDGKVIAVNLKAIAPGAALVSFTSGSILANDGDGTNVIDSNGLPSRQYAVNIPGNAVNNSISTPAYTSGPLAPNLSSPTHPDQNKWYAASDVQFDWAVPSAVDAVRLLYDKNPYSTPQVVYAPPIDSKKVQGLEDGVWYFHAQFHDKAGWGSIANFKFQIDTTPPESFAVRFVSDADPTNPTPQVSLAAQDVTSGIDHYRIQIDNQNPTVVSTTSGTVYTLPVQKSGDHNILAQAFDQAGNYQTAVAQFTVAPIASPTITGYQPQIRSGEALTVSGTTYPSSTVAVYLDNGSGKPLNWTGLSDSNGSFAISGNGDIPAGAYKMYAIVTDPRGAQSAPTDKYDLAVTSANIFGIGTATINLLTAAVSFLVVIFLAIASILYGTRKVRLLKKDIEKETKAMERDVDQAFRALRSDLRDHVHFLEKVRSVRELTREEELVLKQLKDDLARSESAIESDIKKIGKSLK